MAVLQIIIHTPLLDVNTILANRINITHHSQLSFKSVSAGIKNPCLAHPSCWCNLYMHTLSPLACLQAMLAATPMTTTSAYDTIDIAQGYKYPPSNNTLHNRFWLSRHDRTILLLFCYYCYCYCCPWWCQAVCFRSSSSSLSLSWMLTACRYFPLWLTKTSTAFRCKYVAQSSFPCTEISIAFRWRSPAVWSPLSISIASLCRSAPVVDFLLTFCF